MPRTTGLPLNLAAFLDTIAFSELGPELIAASDDGYNVTVGSTPARPDLFETYFDHPRKLVHLSPTLSSTAAGRYQELAHNYDAYKKLLALSDFGPESQDAIAIQQIKEARAMEAIEAGNFVDAVKLCTHLWASLPGNNYGQHQNKMQALMDAYEHFGGTVV